MVGAKNQKTVAFFMLLPAVALLLLFLIIPFFMALGFSFTNIPLVPLIRDGQQVPPDFVGLDNYSKLFRMELITLEPELTEAGEVVRDEAGNIQYPRARTILRGDDRYAGLSELLQFNLFGTQYLLAADDPTFYHSLANIAFFAFWVVPFQTAFALGLAMLVNQKITGSTIFRTIYFSPVVTSMAIVSVIWFFLYNPNEGLINNFLGVFGFGPFQWLDSPQSAMPSIIIMSIWQGVGFQMIIFLAGLQEIPDSLYEASALDGASSWQQFIYVTLPSLRNTTLFVMISTTILALRLYVQVDVMTFTTGGPDDSTITPILHLVNSGFRGAQELGYASALAVVFVLMVLVISLMQRRILSGGENK
jgi:multiple sugar transport system permease protein